MLCAPDVPAHAHSPCAFAIRIHRAHVHKHGRCEKNSVYSALCIARRSQIEVAQIMGELTRRHVVFLYFTESILITLWPYVAEQSLFTPTNVIGPISLIAIMCLLYAYVRLCVRGTLAGELRWWQYTTAVRKMSALSYWSSPVFVLLLLVCTAVGTFVQSSIRSSTKREWWYYCVERPNHTVDCVFTAYVVLAALVNQAAAAVVIYLILYVFTYLYAEIAFMCTHFYFLALFCTLY